MLSSLSSLLIQHFLMFIFLQLNKETGDGQFDSLISSCWILPCCPGCLKKKTISLTVSWTTLLPAPAILNTLHGYLETTMKRLQLTALAPEGTAPDRTV